MRKRSIKIVAMSIIAASSLLLAACGSKTNTGAGAQTTAPTTAAPTTAAPTSTAPVSGQVAVSVGDLDTSHMFLKTDVSSIAAGSVTFTVTNDGVKKHEFVVISTKILGKDLPYDKKADEIAEEGKGIDSPGEIGELKPGESKTVTLDLAAGHYVLVCNIKGHWRMGMYTDFTVS
jgi:uncharacterized cupredoxin-like copper-binding protein